MSTSPSNTPSPPGSNDLPAGTTPVLISAFKRTGNNISWQHSQSQPTSDTFPAISPLKTVVIAGGERIEFASIEKFLDDFHRENPMRFTPQNLAYFTCNYAEKLGSGGFRIVCKGNFPNGMCIAGVLHGITDKRAEEQFMAEVGTIVRTYHVNLVKLYGFCFDMGVKALVYEYMEKGSLERYLFHKNESVEWRKLYDATIGTGKGIRYLHEECEKKIIHYDIKPGNVLSSSFAPKVADFWLARVCDRHGSRKLGYVEKKYTRFKHVLLQ